MNYLVTLKDNGQKVLGQLDYHWVRLAILIAILALFVLAAGAPDDGNGVLTGS